ncbi:dynein heavy chain PWA37_004439 [Arxiozyma heterogenica]|uniref:dynein heavy chain n=1 Tax=Arxiozyma heterogenica TaxID=278026 RepID=UPI002F00F520
MDSDESIKGFENQLVQHCVNIIRLISDDIILKDTSYDSFFQENKDLFKKFLSDKCADSILCVSLDSDTEKIIIDDHISEKFFTNKTSDSFNLLNPIILLLKTQTTLNLEQSLKSQLEILIVPTEVNIDTISNLFSKGVGSLLDYFTNKSQLNNLSQVYVENTKQKLLEISKRFHNINANIGSLRISESLDDSIKNVITKGATLETYRNYINEDLLIDSSFLNNLLNSLNQWIRHCQFLKTYEPPLPSNLTDEIEEWIKYKNILTITCNELDSTSYKVIIDILVKGKRLKLNDPILANWDIQSRLHTVSKILDFLTNLEVENLKSVKNTEQLTTYLIKLSSSLRRFRFSDYPVTRFIAFMEMLTNFIFENVFIISPNIFKISLQQFIEIREYLLDICSQWDTMSREMIQQIREKIRKSNLELSIPIEFNHITKALRLRLDTIKDIKAEECSLSEAFANVYEENLELVNWIYTPIKSLNNNDIFIEAIIASSIKEFNERLFQVETKLIERYNNVIANSASDELFDEVIRYKPLLTYFPSLKLRLQDTEHLILSSVKSNITSLKSQLMYNEAMIQSLQNLGLAELSSVLVQYISFNNKVNSITSNMETLLGPNWKYLPESTTVARDCEYIQHETEIKKLLDTWLTNLPGYHNDLKSTVILKIYEESKKDASQLQLKVNFNFELINYHKGLKSFLYYNFQIPTETVHKFLEVNSASSLAIHLKETLQNFFYILKQLSKFKFLLSLLQKDIDSVWFILKKGLSISWRDLTVATHNNNYDMNFISILDGAVLQLIDRYHRLVQTDQNIIQYFEIYKNGENIIEDFASLTNQLRDISSELLEEDWNNVKGFVDLLNVHIFKLLTKRMADYFALNFFEIQTIMVSLDNGEISFKPLINDIKSLWFHKIEKFISICTTIPIISNGKNSKKIYFKKKQIIEALITDLSTIYSTIDQYCIAGEKHFTKWKSYEFLWDINEYYLQEYLSSSFTESIKVLKMFHNKLKDFENTIQESEIVGIFKIDSDRAYQNVLNKLRYWIYFTIEKILPIYDENVKNLRDCILKQIDELSTISIDQSSIHTILKFVEITDKSGHLQDIWKAKIQELLSIEQIFKIYKVKFPKKHIFLNQVEFDISTTDQLVKKHQKYLKDNRGAISELLNIYFNNVSKNLIELERSWEDFKLNMVSEELNLIINVLNSIEIKLSEVIENRNLILKTAKALSYPISYVDNTECTTSEINNYIEIWKKVSAINGLLNEYLQTSWKKCSISDLSVFCTKSIKELNHFSSIIKNTRVYNNIQQILSDILKIKEELTLLKDSAIKQRHWCDIFRQLSLSDFNISFVEDNQFSLNDVLALKIESHKATINNIIEHAQKEYVIEKALNNIDNHWLHINLQYNEHNTGMILVNDWDLAARQCHEDLSELLSMKNSTYFKLYSNRCTALTEKLSLLSIILSTWCDVQFKWLSMFDIFGKNNKIKELLPQEESRFHYVSTDMKNLLKRALSLKHLIDISSIPNFHLSLSKILDVLVSIRNSLNDFLETYREQYPRFYFLGNDELLKILGSTNSIETVSKYMQKMFGSISNIESKDEIIYGVKSVEGESFSIENTINISTYEAPSQWLTQLEQQISKSLLSNIKSCSNKLFKGTQICDLIDIYPFQILLVSFQIYMTKVIDLASEKSDITNILKNLKCLKEKLQVEINNSDSVDMIIKRKRENILVEVLYYIFTTTTLLENEKKFMSSIKWKYIHRMYFVNDDTSNKTYLMFSHGSYTVNYGMEYIGIPERLIYTKNLIQCSIFLMESRGQGYGACLFGPAGTGKTESIKMLGQNVGKVVAVFNCDETYTFSVISRLIFGIAQVGAWSCFDEFNRLNENVLSSVTSNIRLIQDSLYFKRNYVALKTKSICIQRSTGIFITLNPDYEGRSKLPEILKNMFKEFSYYAPHELEIINGILDTQGFIPDNNLSNSFLNFIMLLKNNCSKQLHYDFGLRTIKRILMTCKKYKYNYTLKNALVKSTRRIILPVLNDTDSQLFYKYETISFSDVLSDNVMEHQEIFEKVLFEEYKKPSADFLIKCQQLYDLQKTQQAIILLGKAGCGKSTIWRTTLKVIKRINDTYNKVYIIDTKVLSKDELYGSLNMATLEWQDGVFTQIVRNCYACLQNGAKKEDVWIVFDGRIDSEYAETINSVLDDNKLLTLPNGERIPIAPNIHLLFETDTLHFATLATISRCSLIWVGDTIISKYDIFINKLFSKMQQLVEDNVLSSTFFNDITQVIRDILPYTLWEQLNKTTQNWTSVFKDNICSTDNALVAGIVSFLISFGSLLEQKDSEFIKNILSKRIYQLLITIFTDEYEKKDLNEYKEILSKHFLLDTDVDNMVFKKLNDELTLVPYDIPSTKLNVKSFDRSDLVITTRDTIYHSELILDFLVSKIPLIFCGPAGVGKTMIINKVLHAHDKYDLVSMNFSKETSITDLVSLFNRHLIYIPDGDGYILYPRNNEKEIVFFFDEINLPKVDKYDSQPVILFLRQLIEKGGFWRGLDNKWIFLKNVHFIGACNPPYYSGRSMLTSQFSRHAGIVFCNYPAKSSLKHIYNVYFNALFEMVPSLKMYSKDFTDASIDLYYMYIKSFSEEKYIHYIVTPRELTRWIKGLLFGMLNGPRQNFLSIVKLWAHEAIRIFSDRLVSIEHKTIFFSNLQDVITRTFVTVDFSENIFDDFFYSKWFSAEYIQISKKELIHLVTQKFDIFCEEERIGNIVIYDAMIDHMLRIDRILRQNQGHGMLVGPNKIGKTTMIKFVAWMNGIHIMQPYITKDFTLTSFDAFLRDVLLKVSIDEQELCLLIDESNMLDAAFLERINYLLTNSDIPDLFYGEELSKLEISLEQKMNSFGRLNSSKDEAYKWFVNQISKNLHIFFTVSDPYKDNKMNSPALFNRCVIDWIGPWDIPVQYSIARKILTQVPVNIFDFKNVEKSKYWILPQNPSSMYEILINIMIHFDIDFFKMVKQYELSPCYYLDCIDIFKNIFMREYQTLDDNQRFITNGLNKLNESVLKMKEMQELLSKKQKILETKEREARKTLDTLLYQQNESERKQEATEEIRQILVVHEEQTIRRHEEIQKDLREIQPIVESARLGVSNIKKQHLTELKSMNKPPNIIKVVLEAVCFLLGYKFDSWKDIQVFLRKDDFVYEIVHYDATKMMNNNTRNILENKYLSNESFNFSSVNRASKACGPLYQWLYAQAKYANVLKNVIPLQEEAKHTKQEMLTAKARLLAAEEMVEDLKADVELSKQKYSSLIRDVEVIKTEMERVKGNLERSRLLISSLSLEKDRWLYSVNSFSKDKRALIGNCLITAIYFSYFGLLDEKQRNIMLHSLFNLMSKCSLEYSISYNFIDSNVKIDEKTLWIENGLPNNDFYLENFCLLINNHGLIPYFIDPVGVIMDVLKKHFGTKLVVISFLEPNYLKRLENSIKFGSVTIIEDGEFYDPALNSILSKEYQVVSGRTIVNIASKDIDVSPEFQLFICSRDPHAKISNFVRTRVRKINFAITEGSVEIQSLRLTLMKESPELLHKKEELNSINSKYKVRLRNLEKDLLETLNDSEGNILDSNDLINTLENIKHESQNIENKVKETDKLIATYNKTTEKYAPLAGHCTRIFAIIKQFSSLSWFFNIPIEQFMQIFESIFAHPECKESADINKNMDNLIKLLYRNIYSMLSVNFDKISQKILASLLYLTYIDNTSDANNTLIVLKILKCFASQEEDTFNLSDKITYDNYYHNREISNLIKLFRDRKFMEIFYEFQSLFGPEDNLTDLLFHSSDCPIIMANGLNEDGSIEFERLAHMNNKKLITIPLGSIENTQIIEMEINQNAYSDMWILLQNIHLSASWVEDYLVKTVEEIDNIKDKRKLKVFMTCSLTSNPLPFKLLEKSYKYVYEGNVKILKIVKTLWLNDEYKNFVKERTFKSDEIASYCNNIRYLLTWLHSIFVVRSRLSPYGFTKRYDFNIFDYKSVLFYLQALLNNFENEETITYLIKYYVKEIIYGAKVDVAEDKKIINSICEEVLTPENIPEKDKVLKLPLLQSTEYTLEKIKTTLETLEEPLDFITSWLGISSESIENHDKEQVRIIAKSILNIYERCND